MTVNHRIGQRTRQFLRRNALLRLLGEDAHASAGQIFKQPRVDHIKTRCCIPLRPTVPGYARRLSGNGRNIFGNLRLNREAEGAEAEAGVGAEGRAAAVMEMDIGNVTVIARPQRGVIELRPNLSCRQAADDNFIGGKIVGRTRQILFRADNGALLL